METRSRKRGEARAAQRPSSSGAPAANKRARLEASASASPTPARRATRSSAAAARAMDDETASAKQRKEEIEKKGKQKESEIQRDVEIADAGQGKEILSSEYDEEGEEEEGASDDFDDDEYDDYDDGMPEGNPGRHFGRSASELHGMLRRLAVFGLPSGGAEEVGKLKRILASLRDEADDFSQISALTELCEILPFASEELRDRFNIDSFVPILVAFLNQEGNPDIMLLAARALTHICDIFPSSCSSVVHHGAIPCFCARLLTIEYMDLAEQSLQALEKISHRHASACLRAGALMAVLSYLDFFSSGVKRVALSTAANISKQLSPDTIDSAMEAIPTLTSLLSDPDAKVVEHASICLARIAGTAALSPEKLEKLSSYGLVSQVASLISVNNSGSGQASLSSPTYSAVIGLLSTCARGSVVFTRELLEMGISGILRDILTSSGSVSQIPSPLSLNGPTDQLCEIVSLVSDLLPSILHETISLPTSHAGSSHSAKKLTSRSCTDNSDREKLFRENPGLLVQFGRDLFPLMIQVYGSSINTQVRHKCLAVVSKVLCLSTADMLNSLLQATNISSFLAGVLTGKDIEVLLPALQIAEVLVQKLPELFSKMFMKEGVVHAVDALISSGATLSGKDKICATGTSLKTRRNRKIAGGSTSEATGMEEIKDSNETKTSSSPALVPSANLDLKVIISAHAKRFKDAYIAANLGSTEAGSTDSLCKLTNLCKKLSGSVSVDMKGKSKGKGKKSRFVADRNDQISSIADILAEVSKDDGVSTFEFVKSGVIASLIDYFAGVGTHKENTSQADLMKHHKETLRKFQSFVDLSLPLDYQGKEAPLITLIRKLQDALASLEHFPVVLSQGSKSHSDNPSSLAGLNAFRRPLKLRLRRAQGEKSLGDHMSSILHIDPLADITDVEDYLWSKVQRNEAEINCSVTEPIVSTHVAVEGRPSTRSRSSTATGSDSTNSIDSLNSRSSKEKGKSVSKSVNDFDGPQTRSAARRRVALEGEPQHKQPNVQSSEEDDDPFVAPVELEQAMALEEDGDDDVEEMFMEEPASVCVVERLAGVELRDLVGGGAMASTSAATDTVIIQASASLKGVSSYRDHPRLNFFIGGKLIDRSSTLFHAIQHNVVPEGDEPRYAGSEYPFRERFWDDVHTITYRRADAPAKRNLREPQKMSSTSMTIKNMFFIDNILQRKLPCDLEKSDSTHDILLLLRVVEGLNGLAPCLRSQSLSDAFAEGKLKSLDDLKVDVHPIPQEEFLSGKLTSKLARQLQDAVTLCSIGLPPWCHQLIKVCPFLFSFETRRQYFYSTALGVQRALHRLQQQQISQNPNVPNNRGRHVGRIQRQKVRVSRKRILESAAKVMELCCGQKTLLEVEYYNEVGTGLGPTLEFYTLISHEMQRSMLGMWRTNLSSTGTGDTVQNGDIVQASHGLFPRPYPPHTDSSGGSKTHKVIEIFCLLGRLMAKALQDGRLLDLPLSTAFYKLVLGKELDIYDIKSFDVELGTTLIEMQALVRRKQFLESVSGDKREEISSLHYRGARIEDLCIDFTLPGFSDYPLKPGGSNILVTIDNLDEYVSLVVDATIKTGIMPQMEALRSGFNQVLCISTLQVFSENEMDTLLCGVRDLWVAEMLTDQIKFDHGYTAQSPPILNFLEIMAEFTPSQQRAFLQFITGCPRLPPGGLSALNPKLTVVRKSSTGPTDANSLEVVDADLPSVMTCANYLKLPPYSTKEVMRCRLLYAITEGQGSFDLS
ncbi:hypothetical protein SUGI_1161700 [Cryptomeria japonica]|uniref:E3 ubiquitin-protein ligase UPL3 isoform X2 n=1 Tax=Cryptomeria japonica TaxID=3369 RepID=UPI0024146CD8|nr:E3 ubiquitin-protein ligase UPL3 isoform X2 [Cryptomeria japonica]GLJ54185.1 hypothetical protein SUGI_1161700 [Cryptomeria japonica]